MPLVRDHFLQHLCQPLHRRIYSVFDKLPDQKPRAVEAIGRGSWCYREFTYTLGHNQITYIPWLSQNWSVVFPLLAWCGKFSARGSNPMASLARIPDPFRTGSRGGNIVRVAWKQKLEEGKIGWILLWLIG